MAGEESSLIGRNLGAYRLEALLGMGEVYRARDTRLRREVAINVKKATAIMTRAGEEQNRNYLARLGVAMSYASEGQRTQALQALDAKLLEFTEAHILGSVAVAEVFAVLDEKDSAVEWLARGVRGGDERLEWFRRDPLLANIRHHSRFKQILESIAYRRQQSNASGQPR